MSLKLCANECSEADDQISLAIHSNCSLGLCQKLLANMTGKPSQTPRADSKPRPKAKWDSASRPPAIRFWKILKPMAYARLMHHDTTKCKASIKTSASSSIPGWTVHVLFECFILQRLSFFHTKFHIEVIRASEEQMEAALRACPVATAEAKCSAIRRAHLESKIVRVHSCKVRSMCGQAMFIRSI